MWFQRAILVSLVVLIFSAAAESAVDAADPVEAAVKGWGRVILDKSIDWLMVEETPNPAQLNASRQRTDKEVAGAQYPNEKRQALRAVWLQINIEYQAFLEESDVLQREDLARRIRARAEQMRTSLWNGAGNLPGESPADWDRALLHANAMASETGAGLPPEPLSAADEARLILFDLLAPGANPDLKTSVAGTFQAIESLAKEAIVVKVQAANALRKLYGAAPSEVRTTFARSGMNREMEQLYRTSGDDRRWLDILALIEGVAAGGDTDQGIIDAYRLLNQEIKWGDGVLSLSTSEFETRFPSVSTYPFPNGLEKLLLLDRAYDAQGTSVFELMVEANKLAKPLAKKALESSQPRGTLLKWDGEPPAPEQFQFVVDRAAKPPGGKPPPSCAPRAYPLQDLTRADESVQQLSRLYRTLSDAKKCPALLPDGVRRAFAILHTVYRNLPHKGEEPSFESEMEVDRWVAEWVKKQITLPSADSSRK